MSLELELLWVQLSRVSHRGQRSFTALTIWCLVNFLDQL